jgi:hypothetical protein
MHALPICMRIDCPLWIIREHWQHVLVPKFHSRSGICVMKPLVSLPTQSRFHNKFHT